MWDGILSPLVKLSGVEFEIAGAPLPNIDAMMADTAADLKSTAMVPALLVSDEEDTCSPQLQLPVLEPASCLAGFSKLVIGQFFSDLLFLDYYMIIDHWIRLFAMLCRPCLSLSSLSHFVCKTLAVVTPLSSLYNCILIMIC